MNSHYKGRERRSPLNRLCRGQIQEGIEILQRLYSVINQSQVQHLPLDSIKKIEESALRLEKELGELGLPEYRIGELKAKG